MLRTPRKRMTKRHFAYCKRSSRSPIVKQGNGTSIISLCLTLGVENVVTHRKSVKCTGRSAAVSLLSPNTLRIRRRKTRNNDCSELFRHGWQRYDRKSSRSHTVDHIFSRYGSNRHKSLGKHRESIQPMHKALLY